MISFLRELEEAEEEGWIKSFYHPRLPLVGWNYTPECQYSQHWTPLTMMCRGLVTDISGNIVARCMEKFFNVEEYEQRGEQLPPLSEATITPKLDGSMVLGFLWKGHEVYCTRGSFKSEQALVAENIASWYGGSGWMRKGVTYVFEYVGPNNRIVVHYDQPDLVLLTVIDTATGKEEIGDLAEITEWGGPFVRPLPAIEDIRTFKEQNPENEEGIVLHWRARGIRAKLKYPRYVELHRLMTGTNEKHVWEHLKNGQNLKELYQDTPDEFYQWINEVVQKLTRQYEEIERQARAEFQEIRSYDRPHFARVATQSPLRAILFRLYDDKEYDKIIWQMIKPTALDNDTQSE